MLRWMFRHYFSPLPLFTNLTNLKTILISMKIALHQRVCIILFNSPQKKMRNNGNRQPHIT